MQHTRVIQCWAIIGLCIGLGLLVGCKGIAYEKTYHFAEEHWHIDSILRYRVSLSPAHYAVGLGVRYRSQYPYYNLYLACSLRRASDQALVWQERRELILFDPKNGQPLGSGSGDLFYQRVELISSHHFADNDTYLLSVRQYMRTQSLEGMVSVGADIRPINPNQP